MQLDVRSRSAWKRSRNVKRILCLSPYNDKGTTFTRTGSFRQTTLTERLADPQSAIIAGRRCDRWKDERVYMINQKISNVCFLETVDIPFFHSFVSHFKMKNQGWYIQFALHPILDAVSSPTSRKLYQFGSSCVCVCLLLIFLSNKN